MTGRGPSTLPRGGASRPGGSRSGAGRAGAAGRTPKVTPTKGTTAKASSARGTTTKGSRPRAGAGESRGPAARVVSVPAARFSARARARRRRRLLLATVLLAAVAAAGWVALGSPWLSVQRIELRGLERVPEAEVRAAVDVEQGGALALVRPQAVAARVGRLRLVVGVDVRRQWPSTLVVTVHERRPVAAVPTGHGVDLVDRDGVTVVAAEQPPAGLPVLRVDVARAGADTLVAALSVVQGLAAERVAGVSAVGASSRDSVWLTLTDGSQVLWGSAEQPTAKARALAGLRARAGRGPARFDVSAPDAPALTGLDRGKPDGGDRITGRGTG